MKITASALTKFTDCRTQLRITSEPGHFNLCKTLSMPWWPPGTCQPTNSVSLLPLLLPYICATKAKQCLLTANAGGRTYPRQVGKGAAPPRDASVKAALDAIPECATSLAGSNKWFEFPITDPVFAGNQPATAQGPDRVIAISPNIGPGGIRTYTYCLAVTHRGTAVDGAFDPCTNAP